MVLKKMLGGARVLVSGGVLALLLPLTGCPFFLCEGKADCGTGSTAVSTTDSGDYAYVSNSTASANSLQGWDLSTGSPVELAGMPFALGYTPQAMVVTPATQTNKFLYVASTAGLIYAYSIASNGALTAANSGTYVANQITSAMDISPDGLYLFVLTAETTGTVDVTEYAINYSTGVLTAPANSTYTVTGLNNLPTAGAIKVAPNGEFLVIALGDGGDQIIPLVNDLMTGTVQPLQFPVGTTTIGDYAVTVDLNNFIYLARTGSVIVYQVTTVGAVPTLVTPVSNTTGGGDHAIVVNSTGTLVYTANTTGSSISTFTDASGVLTLLATPSGPAGATAIGIDTTGAYLVSAGYGTGGFVEYALASGGGLTASSTTESLGSSSSGTTIMALTH